MEEIYIIICLKKETKTKGIPKKLSQCKTVDRKSFDSFFRFYKKWSQKFWFPMETKSTKVFLMNTKKQLILIELILKK